VFPSYFKWLRNPGALASRLLLLGGMSPYADTQTTSVDDAALADLLVRGDAPAWRLFHRRYDRLIYCCVSRVLSKFPGVVAGDDVEETYAEVFYQLLKDDRKKLRAYRPDRGARLGTWIGLISMNAAYDHLRRIQRSHTSVMADTSEAADVPDPGPGPFERVLARQGWGAIRRVMEKLSSKDQRFVTLYFVEGLSPEEVARQMRNSVKTVYSKKHKVRRRLEAMMESGSHALAA